MATPKNKTLIRIDGSYVSIRENDELIRYTGVGSFANTFFGYYRPQNGLLPPAVRWISRDGRAFLCERPPFQAKIFYTDADQGDAEGGFGERSLFEIHVPWQVYLIRFQDERLKEFDSLHLAARKTSIRNGSDELYNMPLPNMQEELEVCMGDGFADQYANWYKERAGTANIGQILQYVQNAFWMLGFNTDAEIPENRLPPEVLEHVYNEEFGFVPVKDLLAFWEQKSLSEVLSWEFTADYVTTVDEWMQVHDTTNPSPSAQALFLEGVEAAIKYQDYG